MSTNKEILNNCFYEQFNDIIETVYKNKNKQSLKMNDILEEFKKLWIEDNIEKVKPEKKKKVVKELLDADRCIALKADGEQCKGRKSIKGNNPLICSLHNNKGPKNGFITYENDLNKEKYQSPVKKSCNQVVKGKKCNVPVLDNSGTKCKTHDSQYMKKVSKFEEDIEENIEDSEGLDLDNDLEEDLDLEEDIDLAELE